jgi:hypothetical protein
LPIPALDLPPGIPERGWTKLVDVLRLILHGLKRHRPLFGCRRRIVGPLDDFFDPSRGLPRHS